MGEVERPRLYRNAAVVFGAADEDADGFVVVVAPEHVIDEGNIEIEFACVFGLELAGFEFNDDVAGLFDVEEQQIDVEVVPVDVEVHLTANECETWAEFAERFRDSAGEGVFEVAFGDFA